MFYIRGGGDGHGIGMSQYGAYGYALHGKDYRFILAHYYQGTTLGATNPKQTIRVLLGAGSAAFSGARSASGTRLKPSMTYGVRALADESLVLLDLRGKRVASFRAPLVVSGPGPLNVAGLGLYRGTLEFRPTGAGGVETVNALGLEDYVRGVIAAEMPAGWSAEALKTQAVAARTYAITTNVGGGAFDVYPDTRSQMYGGVSAETPSTDVAVAATRGQVVTYHGAPAVTYFFASSGGHTENIEDAWPGSTPEPWLRGVADPYDNAGADPYHRWGYDLSTAAAAARLGKLVKGQLVGIQVTKHGASPRILSADIVGSTGRTRVSGAALQQRFGLMTTYAAFTEISTLPGQAPPSPHTSRDSGVRQAQAGAEAVVALVPLVRTLVAGAIPAVDGSVFPARAGDPVTIQVRGPGGWKNVASARLDAGGTYSLQVPGPGTYRIVYAGLNGPAVNVP
jgi:stage II sporulation protein D